MLILLPTSPPQKRLVRDISTVFICLNGTNGRETRFILWLYHEAQLDPVDGRYREINNPQHLKTEFSHCQLQTGMAWEGVTSLSLAVIKLRLDAISWVYCRGDSGLRNKVWRGEERKEQKRRTRQMDLLSAHCVLIVCWRGEVMKNTQRLSVN